MARFWRAALRRAPSWDAALALAAPLGCAGLLAEAHARTDLADAEPPAAAAHAPLALGAGAARRLAADGLLVVDGALSARQLAAARRGAAALAPTRFARAGDHGERGDRVCWVRPDDAAAGDGLLLAVAVVRGVAAALERDGYAATTRHRVPRQCQLARYDAGAKGYDRHLDRCVIGVAELGLLEWLRLSDYRGRAITAILYLNDVDWDADRDGGALRCWKGGDHLRDVAPRGGRLVIFDASAVEHAVLASTAPRAALTCWVSGERAGGG